MLNVLDLLALKYLKIKISLKYPDLELRVLELDLVVLGTFDQTHP